VNDTSAPSLYVRLRFLLRRLWWGGETAGRWIAAFVRELHETQLNLRAMSLVYTSIFTVFPLLAVALSLLKDFGLRRTLTPFLLRLFAPMGSRGVEVTNRILRIVRHIHAGLLGSLGLVVLTYLTVSLLVKLEGAMNAVWRVRNPRRFFSRLGDYLSILIVGPVLVLAAASITVSVFNHSILHRLLSVEPLGALYLAAAHVLPYFLIVAAFTFLYAFMPNTRVRLRAAFLGALAAGVLWESAGWFFASFVASSSSYALIYSSFAVLFLFMVWLYFGWFVILVGAVISFLVQHPSALRSEALRRVVGHYETERLLLDILYLVAAAYERAGPLWNVERLARRLGLPQDMIEEFVGTLEARGLLLTTGDDPPAYVPGRTLGTMRLAEVLAQIRGSAPSVRGPAVYRPDVEVPVDRLLEELEKARSEALADRTVADLLAEDAVSRSVPT
jgi:membrane protein